MAAVFGGAGKWEQTKLLKDGCEILVATPGVFLSWNNTPTTPHTPGRSSRPYCQCTKSPHSIGRLIEMIKTKATNMRRCTLLVLDEADRMFDMGFEAQVNYYFFSLVRVCWGSFLRRGVARPSSIDARACVCASISSHACTTDLPNRPNPPPT